MIWPLLMSFGLPFPLLAWRAERAFRRLPALPPDLPGGGPLPALSVIVPARDEADNLLRLLPSLAAQDYPGPLEIIVVDDASADRTAAVACELGARVVPVKTLPAGWLGKPHACHTGARAAAGEWLLFTDADTRHAPDSARRAVRSAIGAGLDGLSLLLRDEPRGLVERLAMLAAFAGLFAGAGPGRPVLNGQFILVRKQVYLDSGGFAAVRSAPLEDLALAHRLRGCGFQVPLWTGFDAARVRGYTGIGHLWKGLVRLGAGSLEWSGAGGWLTALFITGAVLPVLAVPLALFAGMPAWLSIAAWLAATAGFLPWAMRSGGWPAAAAAPLGALIVQAASLTGLARRLLGAGFRWKGRRV